MNERSVSLYEWADKVCPNLETDISTHIRVFDIADEQEVESLTRLILISIRQEFAGRKDVWSGREITPEIEIELSPE